MSKGKEVVSMKARLLIGLALGLTCLAGALALLVGHGSVFAINGFSDNQELPLPHSLRSPILGSRSSCADLNPACAWLRTGTVYVSSIRRRARRCRLLRLLRHGWTARRVWAAPYPFKYEGQPDNCGIFNASHRRLRQQQS